MPLLPFLTPFLYLFFTYPLGAVASAIGGRSVYLPSTNKIWIFSFSRTSQAGNTLTVVDLSSNFNTLNVPSSDHSKDLSNQRCPIIHFATAFPHSNGISVNVFGIGSLPNGTFLPNMVLCIYNTQTADFVQSNMTNAPLARRNFQGDFIGSGQTLFWGGYSDPLTAGAANGSFVWHPDISYFDPVNGWIPSTTPYSGLTRANATMTQISDTNGQIVIVGGVVAPNNSVVDMVTNLPFANMSDIVLYDPRVQHWNQATATGVTPTPRKHHTTTLLPDGTLLVMGGETFNDTGAFVLNDVAVLNPKNWSWSVPPTKGEALYRSNHTAILIQNQVWMIAGSNATDKAVDIQILDLPTWTWSYKATGVAESGLSSVGGVGGLVGIIIAVIAVISAIAAWVFWRKYKRQSQAKAEASLKDQTTTTTEENDYVHAWAKSQQQHQNQKLPSPPFLALDDSHRLSRGSITALGAGAGSGANSFNQSGSPNNGGSAWAADSNQYFHPSDEGVAAGSYGTDPRDANQSYMLAPFRGQAQKPNLVDDTPASHNESPSTQSISHPDASPVTYYF